MRESLAHTPPVRRAAAGRARPVTMRLAKRLLDLSVALPCLILAAPLLLAVAVGQAAVAGQFVMVKTGARHDRHIQECFAETLAIIAVKLNVALDIDPR